MLYLLEEEIRPLWLMLSEMVAFYNRLQIQQYDRELNQFKCACLKIMASEDEFVQRDKNASMS